MNLTRKYKQLLLFYLLAVGMVLFGDNTEYGTVPLDEVVLAGGLLLLLVVFFVDGFALTGQLKSKLTNNKQVTTTQGFNRHWESRHRLNAFSLVIGGLFGLTIGNLLDGPEDDYEVFSDFPEGILTALGALILLTITKVVFGTNKEKVWSLLLLIPIYGLGRLYFVS